MNDIVQDFNWRIIIDDVSNGNREEFRCSIYDTEHEALAEGWHTKMDLALQEALLSYIEDRK